MQVMTRRGRASDFITSAFPDSFDELTVEVYEIAQPTLMLGSSQSEDAADRERCLADEVEVVKRRSGGGAVFLEPGGCIWIDVLVPRAHPRWQDDVGTAGHWLGEAWIAALAQCGVASNLHGGSLEKTRWGRLICFGALGPGEVMLHGRKLVGVAQRRSLPGARMQCLVLDRWNPADVAERLLMSPEDRTEALRDLADVAVGSPVPLEDLSAAFLDTLRKDTV